MGVWTCPIRSKTEEKTAGLVTVWWSFEQRQSVSFNLGTAIIHVRYIQVRTSCPRNIEG